MFDQLAFEELNEHIRWHGVQFDAGPPKEPDLGVSGTVTRKCVGALFPVPFGLDFLRLQVHLLDICEPQPEVDDVHLVIEP